MEKLKITLAAARKNKNLSRKQLADACGVNAEKVARWERGEQYPNVKDLELLLAALGVTYNDLIFLT